jgi:hypothetical protein
MFLRMLSGFREDLLFGLTPHHVLTPTRWVYLGAFQNLRHGPTSSVMIVEMIHHGTGVVRDPRCWEIIRVSGECATGNGQKKRGEHELFDGDNQQIVDILVSNPFPWAFRPLRSANDELYE